MGEGRLDLGRQGRAPGRARAAAARTSQPPPHWRLEAIAHTPRPRSLTVGARPAAARCSSRTATTSDVWLLDLEERRRARAAHDRPRRRCRTGRTPRRASRRTARTVAYADEGHVWLVPAAGGPPRRLVEGGSPRLDRRRAAC